VGANDLTPLEHVRVQAIAQEFIDSSISKTVNAPNAHTIEDVKELYMAAYDMGLKGITYMRDGSRQGVLERLDKPEEKKETEAQQQEPAPAPKIEKIIKRPVITYGLTYRMDTPVGNAYITINEDENGIPLEVFINGVGKAGSDLFAMSEGLGRMISLSLRLNTHFTWQEKIAKIVDELLNIGGAGVKGFGKAQIRSLPDAVAKVLSMRYGLHGFEPHAGNVLNHKPNGQAHVTNGNGHNGHAHQGLTRADGPVDEVDEQEEDVIQQPTQMMSLSEPLTAYPKKLDLCPDCGDAALIYEEGCKKCYSCGFSKC